MSEPTKPITSELTTFQAGLLQSQSYRALSNFMTRHLAGSNLTLPEWKFIGQLSVTDCQRLSDIAHTLDVEPPFATRIAASLEAKVLIERHADKTDSRAKLVCLTANGRALTQSIESSLRLAMREFLSDITPDELNTYVIVLAKLARKL